MVVVPSLSKRQDAGDRIIAAIVRGGVGTTPPKVIDRVYAERGLDRQKVPQQAAPEQSDQCVVESSADRVPHNCWDGQPDEVPREPVPIDPGQVRPPREVFDNARRISEPERAEPPHVGVPESSEEADPPAAEVLWGVGVAVRIAVSMVNPMGGDPKERGRLTGHASEDHEDAFDRAGGRERSVGEQPVEADRDAEPGAISHCEEADESVFGETVGTRHNDRNRGSDGRC